ncbi:MAG TPA: universal stress protein [Pseudoduganella sp.]
MYKTILLHADASRSAPERLKLAAMLAGQQQAHLICAAMTGISRYVYRQHEQLPHDVIRPDLAQALTARTQQMLEEFGHKAASLGVQSCEQRLVQDDAYGGLVLQSRYADLVIIGQADRDDPATGALLQDLPEFVVLNTCRPVLLVPSAGHSSTIANNILVAWNGSTQAARAIAQALPLLRNASRVVIGIVDPVIGQDEHGEEPGADIGLYLARHGVNVEVKCQASEGDAGGALLDMAGRAQADLLVMGAYGHARFREILLGGATRTVLNTMTLPVLLSH